MTRDDRSPRAFKLDDAASTESEGPARSHAKAKSRKPHIVLEPEPDATALVQVPATTPNLMPRRTPWLGLLMTALFALFCMWAGLSITQLVESFFQRNVYLGWLALGVAGLAGLSALAIILREVVGLLRLARIEGLQDEAARALNLDDKNAALSVVAGLRRLYAARPDSAWGIAQLDSHAADIMDPKDRLHLAGRLLVTPLDETAHRLIARRARRVTLLTTVTPAAALDMLFVGAQNMAMLRELATLYGGKPSTLSTLRLARMVVTHLAVSGGLALSDNFIHLFVGKGLLGKLSARFGEGAVNGILTTRIGLAACEVCRPIPLEKAARETLASLLREMVSFGNKADGADAPEPPPGSPANS